MFVFLQETVFQPHIWQLLKPRLYVLEYKRHLHVKTMQMFWVLSDRTSFLVTPEQKSGRWFLLRLLLFWSGSTWIYMEK